MMAMMTILRCDIVHAKHTALRAALFHHVSLRAVGSNGGPMFLMRTQQKRSKIRSHAMYGARHQLRIQITCLYSIATKSLS